MPLGPGCLAAHALPPFRERQQYPTRERGGFSGSEECLELVVECRGRGLADDGDMGDAVQEEAVSREVAGCGKDGLLRLGIGLRCGLLLGEAGNPLIGEWLLFLTWWLFGRSSRESFG